MNNLYILNRKHEVIPAISTRQWTVWFSDISNRRVAKTDISSDVCVSTVFLGLNHNWSDSKKLLVFETMVFGGDYDGEMERCSTWEEAVEMHQRMVELVTGGKYYQLPLFGN